jgi:hypothetical protein
MQKPLDLFGWNHLGQCFDPFSAELGTVHSLKIDAGPPCVCGRSPVFVRQPQLVKNRGDFNALEGRTATEKVYAHWVCLDPLALSSSNGMFRLKEIESCGEMGLNLLEEGMGPDRNSGSG